MWKVNLSKIQQLKQDPYEQVCWEQVETQGKGPGKISHHTAFVMGTKEVLFYGGMKGEDSNAEIFIFNATTASWQTIHLAVSQFISVFKFHRFEFLRAVTN